MDKRREPSLHDAASADGLSVPRRARRATGEPRRRRGLVARLLLALVILIPAATLLPVLALRWLPPPTTAFMLQSPVEPVRYRWVPRAQIAEAARRAVVAAEDQKFWEHDGFDLEAIEKAVAHNRKSRRKRGASTISQQTAKNLFLWSGGGYFRKGLEAGYTVLIEALWPKARILEVYLNVAEFGPGIYGVEAAAQHYFRKPAATLTATEAARLAAILPSPRRWSVHRPGPYVQKRVRWILAQTGHGPRRIVVEEPALPPEMESDLDEATVAAPVEPLAGDDADAQAPPWPQDGGIPAPQTSADPALPPGDMPVAEEGDVGTSTGEAEPAESATVPADAPPVTPSESAADDTPP